MSKVEQICTEIGRTRVSRVVGVSRAMVSNAVADGFFPASWFDLLEKECRLLGVECPRSAFRFRQPESAGD